ncbi:hypothetical protein BCR44DRAFT_1458403 [Catenaria anguillulae PL171]|uniref:SET domain-containing protein n=1 Tax=Catenaria anguillulae PL171 TaxID=765915 RepID=A0A1Y2I0Z4_9FUNG|nr:hypothetical protein BCR44DRAFT_1458403 [Catenaria anguillulae PL171]
MSSPTESTFKHIPVLRRRSLSSVSDLDSPTRAAPPLTPRKSRRMSLSDPLRRHVPSSVVSLLAALAVIMLSNQLFGLNLLPTGSKSPATFLRGNSAASDGLASSYDRLVSNTLHSSCPTSKHLHATPSLRAPWPTFRASPWPTRPHWSLTPRRCRRNTNTAVKPDPRFRFTMDDFITHLAVDPIHFMEIDPVIAPILAQHDITQDEAYKNEEWEMERRQRRVLGVYAGVLTNNSFTTDYVWTYLSETIKDPATGAVLDLGIDAKHRGNWFRFANDGPAHELNAEVYYVPYNNLWHVVYVASKAIQPDQEILDDDAEEEAADEDNKDKAEESPSSSSA